MAIGSTQTVIKGVRYFLGHAPGLVRHGFNPSREISKSPKVLEAITAHLRCFGDAAAYPPNRAFLGDLYPDELRQIERPWFHANSSSKRRQPHGEIMPEEELLGLLKLCDAFDHVWLEGSFSAQVRRDAGRTSSYYARRPGTAGSKPPILRHRGSGRGRRRGIATIPQRRAFGGVREPRWKRDECPGGRRHAGEPGM